MLKLAIMVVYGLTTLSNLLEQMVVDSGLLRKLRLAQMIQNLI
jgi:hypothetical protein